MINPIQNNQLVTRSAPPVFNEGAASTASKIVAFAAAVIASLASFVFLPAKAALATSVGAAAFLSMLCCIPNEPGVEGRQRRWYHLVGDVFQVVVNAGPRVPVGGVNRPYVVPIMVPQQQHAGHEEGPRASVGCRNHHHRYRPREDHQPPPMLRHGPSNNHSARSAKTPQKRVPVGHPD